MEIRIKNIFDTVNNILYLFIHFIMIQLTMILSFFHMSASQVSVVST